MTLKVNVFTISRAIHLYETQLVKPLSMPSSFIRNYTRINGNNDAFTIIYNVLSAVFQSMSIKIINVHLHYEPTYSLLKIPT